MTKVPDTVESSVTVPAMLATSDSHWTSAKSITPGYQVPSILASVRPGKLYSIFEPHTDMIKRGKANKPVEFGHKIFLAESRRGLVTDYWVIDGNPNDDVHVKSCVDRHRHRFGTVPDLYAVDRGFYSPTNVELVTAGGVKTESIPQRGGTKSPERAAHEKSRRFKTRAEVSRRDRGTHQRPVPWARHEALPLARLRALRSVRCWRRARQQPACLRRGATPASTSAQSSLIGTHSFSPLKAPRPQCVRAPWRSRSASDSLPLPDPLDLPSRCLLAYSQLPKPCKSRPSTRFETETS